MLEKYLNPQYGIAGICILLTSQVLVRVGIFLYEQRTKKETLTETTIKNLVAAVNENTLTMKHLDQRLSTTEKSLNEIPKFKTDIRRFYSAIKMIAGEKWPEIRKEIMEDDISL